MILSLLLATVIFLPVVSYIGILPGGEILFGDVEFNLSTANTTMHIAYDTLGAAIVIPLIVIAGAGLVVATVYSLKKSGIVTPFKKKG